MTLVTYTPMTTEEVAARIAKIRALDERVDREYAHIEEDELLTEVALAFAPPDIKAALVDLLVPGFGDGRVRWYS